MKSIQGKNIILASGSPRRSLLLNELAIKHEVRVKDVEETFPDHLQPAEVALYLAKKKAEAHYADLQSNDILITADTLVNSLGRILNKPGNTEEAKRMLLEIANSSHEVISGVAITSTEKQISFYVSTKVKFRSLDEEEIEYYINNYKPFDKAGAYGIQEWIGYVGAIEIIGSYQNVVGLPTQELYYQLKHF